MHEIIYATSNPTKFQEAHHFFNTHVPHISLKQYSQDIPEIQTLDQEMVAVHKAQEAWNRVQRPVLAEDAGIYFTKYNQFPGTLTKDVYKALGMEGLFKLIEEGDAAFFQLHLVYYYGPETYRVFKAQRAGTLRKPDTFRAHASVPFDDIFVPEGSEKTYLQLREENLLCDFNYRAKALVQFADWYSTQFQGPLGRTSLVSLR